MRVSALRGLGSFANVFAIESFVDELALEAGKDLFVEKPMTLTSAEARQIAGMAESTKRLVAVANRILSEVGLAADDLIGTGHVSMRGESEPDKFVVKGRGYAMDVLPKMQARDMVLCDLDGYWLEGPPETTAVVAPTSTTSVPAISTSWAKLAS